MQKYLKVAIISIYSPLLFGTRLTPKQKQKNQIIFQKLGVLQIRLKLLRLNCVWWWSNVNLFRLYQRKTFSQIERCEVVWSPNLGLLIAFISDDEFGKNLIYFQKDGWCKGCQRCKSLRLGEIKSGTWLHSTISALHSTANQHWRSRTPVMSRTPRGVKFGDNLPHFHQRDHSHSPNVLKYGGGNRAHRFASRIKALYSKHTVWDF